MEIRAEHYPEKSKIIVDKNRFIGEENEVFHGLVHESINKGSKDISVDLSSVQYISSWGIGILVSAFTSCNKKNIRFNITGANQNVMSVLHQVKLDMLFDIQ